MPCTLLLTLACALLVAPASGAAPTELNLRWYGQSAFLLTTPDGARVLMDPLAGNRGYTLPSEPVDADVVTVSHEHPDHANVAMSRGAKVLRGLTAGGKDWGAKIDLTEKGVRIRGVPTFHDEEGGAKRGKNMVFVFEAGERDRPPRRPRPRADSGAGEGDRPGGCPPRPGGRPLHDRARAGGQGRGPAGAEAAGNPDALPDPALKESPLRPVEDFLALFPAARRASAPVLSIPAAPPAAGFAVVVLAQE